MSNQADPRSEKNIATLLEQVQPIARKFLVEVNAQFDGKVAKIISGTRTYEEQNDLYEQGRSLPGKRVTKARGGYSNHNFGIAFDIGFFGPTGLYIDEGLEYDVAGKIGKSLGLTWGGDWESFQDKPHFEWHPKWSKGMSESDMLSELRVRHATGESYV